MDSNSRSPNPLTRKINVARVKCVFKSAVQTGDFVLKYSVYNDEKQALKR